MFVNTNRDRNLEVYTMNPDGTGVVNITNDSSFVDKQPDWGIAPQQQATTLILSAKPKSISRGQSVHLSGGLSTATGELYAGQDVTIEQKPKGATTFSVLKTVSTDFDGKYKLALAVKPKKTTTYQVVYDGNTALGLTPLPVQRRQ